MQCFKCGAEIPIGKMACEKCGAIAFTGQNMGGTYRVIKKVYRETESVYIIHKGVPAAV